jgi:pimeloyl-ACP methyl ester carboxylesterase
MNSVELREDVLVTARHKTIWFECGPKDGPLMIFVHGWPALGVVWRSQMIHFAKLGWRCVAPNMRGMGGSSAPQQISEYATEELVQDLVELHEALGGKPAVWVGHDWGAPRVWSVAAHHSDRCKAVVNLCVPYFSRGFALPTLLPLVDRELYPADKFPAGQWDYWLYYREHFSRAVEQCERDVENTICRLYRRVPENVGPEDPKATTRARGGWFSEDYRPGREGVLLSEEDLQMFISEYQSSGFGGPCAWYMNDAANLAYAARAPNFGKLSMPVLFLHADGDLTCNTVHSRLADPMREDCSDLTEVTIVSGHYLTLEQPEAVNGSISEWIYGRQLA